MYSGTTLTKFSGRLLGAHQKIDRIARKHLDKLLPEDKQKLFPSTKNILKFEGREGPDGIKRKSPAQDEPWHYFNPFDEKDTGLLKLIDGHYKKLVASLKESNNERAAFESAWLAHALVDGLTPAHHYPYEEKLTELRGGEGLETRTSIKEKWVIPGETRPKQVKNNWQYWGPRGLFLSHGLFEMGVASIIKPLSFRDDYPSDEEIKKAREIGLPEYFKLVAREIGVLDMFVKYHKKGWTPRLAYDVRHKLGPTLVKTVTLGWFMALEDAGLVKNTGKK